MRVAVSAVAARKAGGSTLILEKLIAFLPEAAPEHHFRFFVSPGFVELLARRNRQDAARLGGQALLEVADNVELVSVPIGSQLSRLAWDQFQLPRRIRHYRADISVNALGFGPLFPGKPQVTVLQDSTYFCDMRSYQRLLRERMRTAAMARLLVGIMKRSARVVVPSRALADAIVDAEPALRERITVLRDPFEADFADPHARSSRYADAEPRSPLRILYLSHLEPHKAHSILPDVASRLRERVGGEFVFVVAIDRRDNPRLYDDFLAKVSRSRTSDHFEIHDRLGEQEVSKVLDEADVFFFPSLCESFGYPMLEAGAAGLPVVAADTPINREMLGASALYFEPLHVDKAVEALGRLVVDPRLRGQCAAGIQDYQRSLFPSWREYASKFVHLIEGAVREGNT